MTTIASLMVSLGMNTAKFDTGARKATTSLRSIAEGAVALNGTIGIMKEAGHLIESAFESFGHNSEQIDSIGKLSDRLGISTEGLVALQHAAGLAGVDTETLDTAIQKLNINLGKAARASDDKDNPFKTLGLDVQKLIDMGPEKSIG